MQAGATYTGEGRVIIAGAGPGDPELITLRAARSLQEAEVVLTDRLVSEEILQAHVRPGIEVVRVGKQCRRGVSTPQQVINELMVTYALEGKRVVRLKGGDVSIFSNILDELQVLVKHNIPYEIVPGITAAMGAAATAGIPLTARGYATAVRFLTLYKKDIVTDAYWKDLAATDDTLVFYMTSETLAIAVAKLTANNIDAGKLLAVVEQATTPLQNVHIYDPYQFTPREFISPSLVIIGRVVALQQQFAWLENNDSGRSWFQPITSPVITIDNNKNRKHVSRA